MSEIASVFCNIPWVEVHINADGTYHTCGSQPNTISNTVAGMSCNVHKMTIPEWINSQHQCTARTKKLNGVKEPLCGQCYGEEAVGSSSKRIKENLKSSISQLNFVKDYVASPHYEMFEYSNINKGLTDNLQPFSFHISLGNECNLACKMCGPTASSRLAADGVKEGTYHGPISMNWTRDDRAWNHVVDYMCTTPNLKFVHIIGGEPLMNKRFEDLIDRLLAAGKTDIYFGFTTNATIVNEPLIKKLTQFRHVDIGVSIESAGELNDAVRTGTDTEETLDNIDIYLKYRSEGHVYVTVRPVPSALTVHTLDELYQWCLSRRLDVLTNWLVFPEYQQIQQLPQDIKDRLLEQYSKWEYSEPLPGTSDPRDPNRYAEHIDNEIRSIITALKQPNTPELTTRLYRKLYDWGWLKSDLKKYFEI